jgi:hypothetical protein
MPHKPETISLATTMWRSPSVWILIIAATGNVVIYVERKLFRDAP